MKPFFAEADCEYLALYNSSNDIKAISLDKANRLLSERGTVVYSGAEKLVWKTHPFNNLHAHTALLIHIQPIEQDSAESFVKDFITCYQTRNQEIGLPELFERARKLVGK